MIKSELLNLYDAVLNDNGKEVKKILNENVHSHIKINARTLTGLLVIAVDGKLVNATNAILSYNESCVEKISQTHFNTIICLAAKSNLLSQLEITIH